MHNFNSPLTLLFFNFFFLFLFNIPLYQWEDATLNQNINTDIKIMRWKTTTYENQHKNTVIFGKKKKSLFLQQFSIRNQKLKYVKDTWKEYLEENCKEKLNGI